MTPYVNVDGISKKYRRGEVVATSLRDAFWTAWKRNISKEEAINTSQDEFWALKDISFKVNAGEGIGVLGKNGAGKSTLLRVLARLTGPSLGSVRLNGRVASLLQVGAGFHPDLTGRENIFLNGAFMGMNRAETNMKFSDIVEFSEIGPWIDSPVKKYSHGMYLRLAFSVAVFLRADIIMMDEVLENADLGFQQKCIVQLKARLRQGNILFLISHHLNYIESLCTRALLLDGGVLKVDGSPQEVIRNHLRKI